MGPGLHVALVCGCMCVCVCVCPAETMKAAQHPAWVAHPRCLQPGLSKSPDSPGVRPHSNTSLLVSHLGT